MAIHEDWIDDEYDTVTIRVASMGEIFSWADWDDPSTYEPAKTEDVAKIEALLIFSHHPLYNQTNKESMAKAKGIRIFNTGKIGNLLPEVSYRYYNEDYDW